MTGSIDMAATAELPAASPFDLDDPDVPGTYLTDGEQLYRVLGAGRPPSQFVAVEDCRSLDVYLVASWELLGGGLATVCRHGAAPRQRPPTADVAGNYGAFRR